MTAAEWEAYGDASASHQAVTINGVEYTELSARAKRRSEETTLACARGAHSVCSGDVKKSSYGPSHPCPCGCHLNPTLDTTSETE